MKKILLLLFPVLLLTGCSKPDLLDAYSVRNNVAKFVSEYYNQTFSPDDVKVYEWEPDTEIVGENCTVYYVIYKVQGKFCLCRLVDLGVYAKSNIVEYSQYEITCLMITSYLSDILDVADF